MALHKKKKGNYGDFQSDIPESLSQYSRANGYEAEHFADAVCRCGGTVFQLLSDENEGVAIRTCIACQHQHPVGDSEEFLEEAELEASQCLCASDHFEITVGVALYADSQDVRWIYIGCRCPDCGLTGCYADWKNEFEDYRELLKRV